MARFLRSVRAGGVILLFFFLLSQLGGELLQHLVQALNRDRFKRYSVTPAGWLFGHIQFIVPLRMTI